MSRIKAVYDEIQKGISRHFIVMTLRIIYIFNLLAWRQVWTVCENELMKISLIQKYKIAHIDSMYL